MQAENDTVTSVSDCARHFLNQCDIYNCISNKVAKVVYGNHSVTVTVQIHSHMAVCTTATILLPY